jgi:hypothetical protein
VDDSEEARKQARKLFEARLDVLDASGYLSVFEKMIRSMCAPFWWSSRDPNDPLAVVRQNGTIRFVNTGERRIGVTADHVYQAYLDDKGRYPDVECQIGNNTISPETRLIDRSPETELDLATFDIPEVFLSASGNPLHHRLAGPETHYYHHNALKWPADPLQPGEVVAHGGFPQVLREPMHAQVDFPFQYFVTRVNSVDVDRIVLEPGADRVYWPGHAGEPINTEWHGQSGGPVYRILDGGIGGNLVDRVEVVGFIYQRYLEWVLVRPSLSIHADGTIVRPLGSLE